MTGTPFASTSNKICGSDIGNSKMGRITSMLIDVWSKNVGVDIVGQIKD